MDEMSTKDRMWKTLVRTLNDYLTTDQTSVIEHILDMIKTDLTYEDPGLFEPETIYSQPVRTQEAVCNMWLLNQLIYVITKPNYDR
jgi:hypothetical protein